MKRILCFTLLTFYTGILFGQSDYAILELRRGSKLTGNLISKSYKGLSFQTSLHDTIVVRNQSVKRLYIVEEHFDEVGDVPVLSKGRYYTIGLGVGGGRQRINAQNIPFFIFPGSIPIAPVTQYSPLIITRLHGSIGYQFNRYFGLGVGLIIRHNSAAASDIVFFNNPLNANFLVEGKFNYPLRQFGNKDIWIKVNALQHVEVSSGISFLLPKKRLDVGIGFFKSFNSFQADTYLSIQCGMQL